jgi:hypothetical protein
VPPINFDSCAEASQLLKFLQVAAFGKSTVKELDMLELILSRLFEHPRGGGWA